MLVCYLYDSLENKNSVLYIRYWSSVELKLSFSSCCIAFAFNIADDFKVGERTFVQLHSVTLAVELIGIVLCRLRMLSADSIIS